MSSTTRTLKPIRVCFSFAAYAKNVIHHLRSSDISIMEGLSEFEFSCIESSLGFTFPPDLRSILREGLPLGPGFPNWRASSPQQLEILTNLPILGLCKEVAKRRLWLESWGEEPDDREKAVAMARKKLKKVPVLVPIYRHCYVPSKPSLAGNPVFFVKGGDVRISSFDVAGFFEQTDFGREDCVCQSELSARMKPPAWAATAASRIEFWSDFAERGRTEARESHMWRSGGLGSCLDDVASRLRDGGWKEEEVREMMAMDGCGERKKHIWATDSEGVECQLRLLSLTLLRAGWSKADVVYSLGFQCDGDSFLLDFQRPNSNGLGLEVSR